MSDVPVTAGEPRHRTSRSDVGRTLCWIALILAPTAAMFLYLKDDLLQKHGYAIVTRHLGRSGTRDALYSGRGLTALERLTLFRDDVVLVCVLLPLCAAAIGSMLPRRYRATFVATVGTIAILFGYVQFRCLKTTGALQSFDMLHEAVVWAFSNRSHASHYFGASAGHLKVVVLVGATWLIAAVAHRALCCAPGATRTQRSVDALHAGGVLTVAVVIAVGSLPLIPRSSICRSACWEALVTFVGQHRVPDPEIAQLDRSALREKFREISNTPQPEISTRFTGTCQGHDVIWFMLETTPARLLSGDDSLDDLPSLKRLSEHAYIPLRHHATFPYTLPALFSLVSSWYPLDWRQMTVAARGRRIPGVADTLRTNGYATALYCPDTLSDSVESTLLSLGIDRTHTLAGKLPGQSLAGIEERIERDRAVLGQFLQDVDRWSENDQRYFAVFMPQIGHAPWLPMPGAGSPSDVYETGRALLALQDEWLGRLLEILEANGRLDRTIIVVTGDHGIRTVKEDPAFETGMLDARSFHVPAFVYAPGAFESPQFTSEFTSHVDVGPSVLELLGLHTSDSLEQGLLLWDHSIGQRTTFLWAGDFMGVDGFHEAGHFYALDLFSGATFESPELLRQSFVLQPQNSAGHQRVTSVLKSMHSIQQRWFEVGARDEQVSPGEQHADRL